MSKPIAAYVRVSNDEKKAGYTLIEQIDSIKDYCSQNGYHIQYLFSDDGFNGDNINRPDLMKLINEVTSHSFVSVITLSIDRLSLSHKQNLWIISEVFMKNNIEFVSIRDKINTATQSGRDIINALETFVALERQQKRNEIMTGRTNRAAQGKWHGGGTEPIGYDYINGKLTVNKAEAEQVKQVYYLYSQGFSMPEISLRMQGYKTKHGDWEHLSTISNVLDNPLYVGIVHFNDVNTPNSHTPIIDRRTDTLVKRRREKSLKFNQHQNDSKHLLSGLLFCGNCGARYFPRKFPDGEYRYICYSRAKTNKKMVKDPNCRNLKIDKAELEQLVINRVLELKTDPTLISEIIKKRTTEGGSSDNAIQEELTNIDRQINDIKSLLQQKQISEVTAKSVIDSLTIERQYLMLNSGTKQLCSFKLEEFKINLSEFSATIESKNIKYCRHLLSLLVERIEIYEGELIFQWAF